MKYHQEHMKLIRKCSTFIGIWPVKLSGWKSRAYKMYSNSVIIFYGLFMLSMLIKLLELIFLEKDYKEFEHSLTVIIPFCFGGYRYIICTSRNIRECLIMVYNIERKTLKFADENIKKIHRIYTLYSMRIIVIFYSFMVNILLYIAKATIHNIKIYKSFNGTNGNCKFDMVYQTWFPFDENKHYVLAFLINLTSGNKIKMKIETYYMNIIFQVQFTVEIFIFARFV